MFIKFQKAVQKQFDTMSGHPLFRTRVDKDVMWEHYLASYPEGTNPLFRERTEHDCNCCKQFIRAVGNVVAVIEGKLVSLWDIEVGVPHYQAVANAMASLVKSAPIENIFLHTEPSAGVSRNYDNATAKPWDHFYLKLPPSRVVRGDHMGTKLSDSRSTFDVLKRGLTEIKGDAIETVLELIAQNSLYRGEESKHAVSAFGKLQTELRGFAGQADLFLWTKSVSIPQHVARLRNTAIGTLLVDLSDGADVEQAVRAFESKVAPQNYKRPTAIVTPKMVENAKAKIQELGYETALDRRYATIHDITVNNILFADRQARKEMDVFDTLAKNLPVPPKKFDKVEEVDIERFINQVLPSADSIELLFEGKHTGNLVSLIAPEYAEAKNMLKWDNNFGWSYNGEVTDSIKERVKNAGGRVDGYMRCSLSWFNEDDLDLHMDEPDGTHIYFGSKRSPRTGGNLDVDMNAGGRMSTEPVENICYPNKSGLAKGTYTLFVNNFNNRTKNNVGFEVEIEIEGTLYRFAHPGAIKYKQNVEVAELTYDGKTVTVKPLIPCSQGVGKEVWGVSTNQFHRVSVVMHSPNHWDGQGVGNKHYFFMLDGCANPEGTRGFYNEFLREELNDHRKVFELLGAAKKVKPSKEQLSGLGFSSTKRDTVKCKVTGAFTRIIQISF